MSIAIATPDRIREVALELYSRVPSSMTITAVTEIIGGGSRSTVGPILRQIREEVNAAARGATAVPAELRAKADSLIQSLMSEASAQARREYETSVARLDSQMSALEADVADASAEVDALRAAGAKLSRRLDDANLKVAELEGQLADKEAALASEKIDHDETRRLLEYADQMNALQTEDQARKATIDEQISRLTTLVASMATGHPSG